MTAIDWITARECAEAMGVGVRHVERLAKQGKLVAVRDKIGRRHDGLKIAAHSLPSHLAEQFEKQRRAATEEPVVPAADVAAERDRVFKSAPVAIRRRAMVRLEVVESYRAAMREALAAGKRLGEAETDWHAEYCERTGCDAALRTVRRWADKHRRLGLPGLLDRNDGSARRGKFSVPREALNCFFEFWLDKDRPAMTIAAAIRETRLCAQEMGWKLPRRDDAFYRFAKTIPDLVKRARKDAVDAPQTIAPFAAREMDRPGRTLMSDHHLVDVFVSCEGTVCDGGECRQAHRPWWTPMFDVGSRKILSHRISLDDPNSTRILDAFRAAVEAEGLPERLYVDNGKDFKKATGKNKRFSADEQSFLENRFAALGVKVVWAIPYNAQAKAIERMFGTFVNVVWRTFESYVGRLGKRSERANHLYKNPHLCPTFTQFCERLEAEVALYNNRPHRGFGMKGRTPAEVFAKERIPMRRPDRAALALIFWRCETRVLDRNGVRIGGLVYRIDDAGIQVRYQGQRVKVLVDPADVSRAILCSAADEFLCEATVAALATHDTSDRVTQEVLEAVGAKRKAIRKLANAGDSRAQFIARNFKAFAHTYLVREAERRREHERELAAAVGEGMASAVVLPRFSKIARDVDAYCGADAFEPPPLTPAQLAIAATAEDHSEEFLDIVEAAEKRADLATSIEPEQFERLRVIREQNLRRARGECLDLTCDDLAWHNGYCRLHQADDDDE